LLVIFNENVPSPVDRVLSMLLLIFTLDKRFPFLLMQIPLTDPAVSCCDKLEKVIVINKRNNSDKRIEKLIKSQFTCLKVQFVNLFPMD
jgi:hypothetical protein